MKKSEIVKGLADLASKVQITITPANVNTVAVQTNRLFQEAAKFINELEAMESEEDSVKWPSQKENTNVE